MAGLAPTRLAVRLVLSLLAVSVLVFLLTIAVPGDPARAALGKAATPAQLKAFDAAHGLDAPLYEQFGRFLQHLVQGKLGTRTPPGSRWRRLIGARFERTFFLVLIAWLIAALISIPVGMWSGRRAGSVADSAVSGITLGLAALPEFVIGLLLVFIVGVKLGWLPVNSTQAGLRHHAVGRLLLLPAARDHDRAHDHPLHNAAGPGQCPGGRLRAVHQGGHSARRARARLTFMHVLPNAAPPVLNALALQFAGSIGGVVVTETVFGFPGIGQLLVQAVGSRDLPVVQAITMIIGAVYVLVNTLADAGVRLRRGCAPPSKSRHDPARRTPLDEVSTPVAEVAAVTAGRGARRAAPVPRHPVRAGGHHRPAGDPGDLADRARSSRRTTRTRPWPRPHWARPPHTCSAPTCSAATCGAACSAAG